MDLKTQEIKKKSCQKEGARGPGAWGSRPSVGARRRPSVPIGASSPLFDALGVQVLAKHEFDQSGQQSEQVTVGTRSTIWFDIGWVGASLN